MRFTHGAAAAALLALSAAAACSPAQQPCETTPAHGTMMSLDNPYRLGAPTVVGQENGHDSGFGIQLPGDAGTVQIATTEIRGRETYQDARNRAFIAGQGDVEIKIPAGRLPLLGFDTSRTRNREGGNAVPYGIVVTDAGGSKRTVSFADVDGMRAAGYTPEQAVFIERVAATHTEILNGGAEGLDAYFKLFRTQDDVEKNPEAAAALLQQAVEATIKALDERFGSRSAVLQQTTCLNGEPVARAVGDGGAGSYGDTEGEPGKFPWQPFVVLGSIIAAAWALSKLGGGVAAPVKEKEPSHRFELLHSINEAGKEVIVYRNTGAFRRKEDRDAIWVFERETTDRPAIILGTAQKGAYVGDTVFRRAEEDKWRVTTGPEGLASLIAGIMATDNLSVDQKREQIRALTANKGPEKLKLFKQRGWLSSIVARRSVIEAAGLSPNISQTMRAGKPLPCTP